MRQERNLTQRQLGHLIGVSNRVVSKWETGISVPDADSILALSEFYGIPADFLLREEPFESLFPLAEPALPSLAEAKTEEKRKKKRGTSTNRRSLIPPPSDELTGDYFCSWRMQKEAAKKYGLRGRWKSETRDTMTSNFLFGKDADLHPLPKEERRDLIYLLDDGWDVPFGTPDIPGKAKIFGSLEADAERFSDLGRTPEKRLRKLCENIRNLGYGATGLWIACEYQGENSEDIYRFYAEHAKLHEAAGVRYWKVSRGTHEDDTSYQEIISQAVRKNAKEIRVGHRISEALPSGRKSKDQLCPEEIREITSVLSHADVARIRLVLTPFGDTVLIRRLHEVFSVAKTCKDANPDAQVLADTRPYLAAVFGCAFEMICADAEERIALRFHRLSPPFSVGEADYRYSTQRLIDRLYIEMPKKSGGMSSAPAYFEESAPATMSRGCPLPTVRATGDVPFVVASKNPRTHVYAIGTFPRNIDPNPQITPLADVELEVEGDSVTLGVFGIFDSLTLVYRTVIPTDTVILIQDFLDNEYQTITQKAVIAENKIRFSGTDLRTYGRSSQTFYNERSPACLIQILFHATKPRKSSPEGT